MPTTTLVDHFHLWLAPSSIQKRLSNCSANTLIPGGALWCPHFSEITAHDLVRARELGLCVAVWTVNEPADINAMIDLRVDAIVTDYPGRVQRRLSDRGFRWAR
ncbi:MAG: hypothetical protein ISP39_09230 [Alphaproteobacteria bacterium]|nr:hypothetical protein [Alphaproteobacteria bacterium]MBL6671961.1 hypothetical protein [Alphaproteobacteria bacterium]